MHVPITAKMYTAVLSSNLNFIKFVDLNLVVLLILTLLKLCSCFIDLNFLKVTVVVDLNFVKVSGFVDASEPELSKRR